MAIKRSKEFIKDYPAHTVFLSLLITICIGTILLTLPIARTKSIDLIDIFFTIICIANGQKINLESAWRKMVEEKMKRDENRYEKKG